jgi:hypothetical protein
VKESLSAKFLDERPDAAINVLRMSSSQNTRREKAGLAASKSIESISSPAHISTISRGAPVYANVSLAKSVSKFGTIGSAP